MIRRGKTYRRIRRPHTVVTVVRRAHGRVTYQLRETQMTISVAAFKEIYGKVRRWPKLK